MANRNNSSNQLVAPGAQAAIDQMKYEIATEFGVSLGADTTSRSNGCDWRRNHKAPCSNG